MSWERPGQHGVLGADAHRSASPAHQQQLGLGAHRGHICVMAPTGHTLSLQLLLGLWAARTGAKDWWAPTCVCQGSCTQMMEGRAGHVLLTS